MSFGFHAHHVDSLRIDRTFEHSDGSKSFRFEFGTKCGFYGEDLAELTLFVNPSFVPKMERIAAAISAIMAEPDAASAPLVETFAAE